LKSLYINSQIKNSHSIFEIVEKFLLLKNSVHTRRAYKNDIFSFFNSMGIFTLDEFSQIKFDELIYKIQHYIDGVKKLEVLESRQRVINAKTVNRKVNALRSFFAYLINVYNYPKNPLDSFSNLKVDHFSNTQSMSRGEILDLLNYTKKESTKNESNYRNYLIIVFLFHLALRREEVANLKWDDIDLGKQTANIYQKGGSYKLLPLPFALAQKLLDYKLKYGDSIPYIFHPIQNNSHKNIRKPLSTDYIFKIIKNITIKVVPSKKITPHSLRKTFIELALNNGDDLISIANATGHSTIEMIKYYDTRNKLKNNSIHSLSKLL